MENIRDIIIQGEFSINSLYFHIQYIIPKIKVFKTITKDIRERFYLIYGFSI
jgi:hypothetical protein